MKVLVTGASGFVGQRLCRVLDERGHAVVRAVRSMSGDIGPSTDWQPALAAAPEAVVHLAARVHVMRDTAADPLAEFRRVNVEGTLQLARQAAAAGARRFVFVSTAKVNGERSVPGQPLQADQPPAPEDAYALSKLEAEQALLQLAPGLGLEVVIVRPPLVYGPGVQGNFASLVRWVRRGVPLPLGAVHNQRSLVALDNLVDFIALCADRQRSPAAGGQAFLVADAVPVSTTQLLQKVAAAYGAPARLLPVPAPLLTLAASLIGRRAAADRLLGSLVVDTAKATDLLGWKPAVGMDEQLKMMANHDAANP